MAKLILKFSKAPEDEIEEVKALFDENDISYHETGAGFFGLSVAGLWITHANEYDAGIELFNQYQRTRYQLSQEALERQRQNGELVGWQDMAKRDPIIWLRNIALIAVVLVISFLPVWLMFG